MSETPIYVRHSHCSFCGTKFPAVVQKHARCAHCGKETWLSPAPVVALLLPVLSDDGHGIVLVRRNIEPKKGGWCLPSGYIDFLENAEEAGLRELGEEAAINLPPDWPVHVLHTRQTQERIVVVFCQADPIPESGVPCPFVPNDEVQEIMVVRGPIELCFSTHTEALKQFFDRPRGDKAS